MPMNRRQLLAVAAATPFAPFAHAQSRYPERPVKLILPFPPGGPTDAAARLFAQKLEGLLGQPFVVDNRPGASTNIGNEAVARSPADGYTLLFNMTALVTNPILLPNVSYDAFRDFAPVSRVYSLHGLWGVPGNGAKTLAEFIRQAKASPKPLTFATTGHASSSHYFGEVLARSAGIKLNHVPYKGEAQLLPDLLAGRVDAAVVSSQVALTHGREGKVNVLAITGPTRLRMLPELPTFEEQGVTGLALESFCGVFAPAGTPAPVVERLNDAINKALQMPDVQQRITGLGVEISPPGTPAQFTAVMRKAHNEWLEIKKRSEIRFE